MVSKLEKRWDRFAIAMTHFQEHIQNKGLNKFSLSIVDLLHVSNFKGGNASITEPNPGLSKKLEEYSKKLEDINKLVKSKTLKEFSEEELKEIIRNGKEFLELTETEKTKINGFGASYASALISAYFIDVFPIIDRRVLNGAGIEVEYISEKTKQVKNISSHYETLVEKFYKTLKEHPQLSLRQLDKQWFSKELKK